jgi:AraC-like DNA-binding protein
MEEKIYNGAKLSAVLTALEQRHIETDHALDGSGLKRSDLTDKDLRVSSAQILQVYKTVADRNWHPHLAYEIGSNLHVSAYGMYGYAMLCSTRYRDTVQVATRFHALAAPTAQMQFMFEQGEEGWNTEPAITTHDDRDFYAFLVALQMGTFNTLHRDIFGLDFMPPLIELRFQKTDKVSLPEHVADQVIYGANRNRYHVPAEWLDRKLELGNDVTFPQLVEICKAELSELSGRDGVVGQVRRFILENAAFSANMETTAEQLRMTSRTLRRHLKREQTTFSEIVDSVRTELALKYLREAVLSTEEIAHLLGFSETSSFVRAFKRWTGKNPRAYRYLAETEQNA